MELGHQNVSLTTLLSFPVDGVPVLPRLWFLMSVCERLSSSCPIIPPPLPSHLPSEEVSGMSALPHALPSAYRLY